MKSSAHLYRPGFRVLNSGVYEVWHYHQHRAAHRGELLLGEIFPYCKECKSRVRFKFKSSRTGVAPSLTLDLSFNTMPTRATAAALFKAAFGRRMTSDERAKIGNYKDNWRTK